jgi:HAD superfamily hydrolase (TIGR01549 family)
MTGAFERLLGEVSVLSLDIFDTTLGRLCALPEDAFRIIEEQLVAAHGEAFTGFAVKRREVDTRARRRAWDQRQSEEISLADIHAQLLEENPTWPLTAEALARLEMDTEARLLYPIEPVRELIAAARKAGKRVIFVSDMYLPRAFCEKSLRDNGFSDYDELFLSSDTGLLKHSGKLFAHVIAQLGVAPEQILHVGDNAHSDGTQAARLGIRTLQVTKAIDRVDRFPGNPFQPLRQRSGRNPPESLLLGLSARGCLREQQLADPFWYRIGYQIAGPLIYGYVQFLRERLRGRGIGKVYFLSRDGYILKRVYEILTSGLDDCPRAEYLHASRRALNFASISAIDPATENWLAEGIHLTVADFLQRIDLDPADHLEAIRASGFDGPRHKVVGGHEYQCLRHLYRRLEPAIVAAAAGERRVYLDYLRAKGAFDANPFALVDVGWMTSIQRSFDRLIHAEAPELPIEGYYLGSYPEAARRAGPLSRHIHYLMAYGKPESALDTIRHCVCLIEFFFAAPEHTFLRMERDHSGGFQPVLADFHENEADLPMLEQIHDGAIEYARAAVRALPGAGLAVPPEAVLGLLNRLLANPTREEAERLGELKYADGYGAFFHHTCMARPSSLAQLGLNKRRWKDEFKGSHWPRGYYARLSPLGKFLFRRLHPRARFSKPYG